MSWSEGAFRDEIEHHLEASTLDGMRQGLDEATARTRASERFGDVADVRRRCRRVALVPRRAVVVSLGLLAGGVLIMSLVLASTLRELAAVRARLDTALANPSLVQTGATVQAPRHTVAALLDEARRANRGGDWSRALVLAERAVRAPEATDAQRCVAFLSKAHAHRCLAQPREARAALTAAEAELPAARRPDLAHRIARLSARPGYR